MLTSRCKRNSLARMIAKIWDYSIVEAKYNKQAHMVHIRMRWTGARIEFHVMTTIVLVFPQHCDCLAANDFERTANEKHNRFDFFCTNLKKNPTNSKSWSELQIGESKKKKRIHRSYSNMVCINCCSLPPICADLLLFTQHGNKVWNIFS